MPDGFIVDQRAYLKKKKKYLLNILIYLIP